MKIHGSLNNPSFAPKKCNKEGKICIRLDTNYMEKTILPYMDSARLYAKLKEFGKKSITITKKGTCQNVVFKHKNKQFLISNQCKLNETKAEYRFPILYEKIS